MKLSAIIFILLCVLSIGNAEAHPPEGFYWQGRRWDLSVEYNFMSSFTATQKQRVRDALMYDGDCCGDPEHYNWSVGANRPLTWTEGPGVTPGIFFGPTNYCNLHSDEVNGIVWWDLNAPGTPPDKMVLAWTPSCYETINVNEGPVTHLVQSFMFLETHAPWYFGSESVPSNKVDFWAVVTHEFGHATGWYGHYAAEGEGCSDANVLKWTMCPTIPFGQARMRTIESHDRHTFRCAYQGIGSPSCDEAMHVK